MQSLIPVQLRATFEAPMVAWYYPQTLGQKLFNYKHFVKTNNVDKLVQIAQGECECHRNQDFINPDHGHITTCDVNVLRHIQLRNLVSKGTKHRWWSKKWEREGMDMADGGCPILRSISNALANWKEKFARDNETIEPVDLEPFCVAVLSGVQRQIGNLPLATDEEPDDLDNLLKAIKQVRKRFVVSYVDTFSSKFMFTCPKFYAQSLLKKLCHGN